MDDEDLQAIRAQRMAQLQNQYSTGGQQGQSKEQQEEMRRKQEEMKNNILVQVLDQQARSRLNTIALTKPEKAKMVESMLIQMAQTGQIQGKLGEVQLKSLLERVSEKTTKTTTVKFDRRRAALDSDED
jgi:programmed cell death protein 5